MNKNEFEPVLRKVQNLVKLAADGPDTDEARTAAIQVTRLMKEHELVLLPRSEFERLKKVIEGARDLAKQSKDDKLQNMAIGALGALLLTKAGIKL